LELIIAAIVAKV